MEIAERAQRDSDLEAHERTYRAFNALLRWSMAIIGSGTLMLTLWFATGTGFFASLVIGVVAFALSYYFLLGRSQEQPADAAGPHP